MSDGGPKLFTNKPKKSKLKASTPITSVTSPSKGAAAPPLPPPPPVQKEPFFQRFKFPLPQALERYRFLVPFVLFVNFTIGAYTLVRVTMGKKGRLEDEIPDPSSHFTSNPAAPTPSYHPAAAAATITEKPVIPSITEPIQRLPIPEDQRRELFKWMLEERRKVKPKNAEEKKRIDEEKAVLKQFIEAKSLPL